MGILTKQIEPFIPVLIILVVTSGTTSIRFESNLDCEILNSIIYYQPQRVINHQEVSEIYFLPGFESYLINNSCHFVKFYCDIRPALNAIGLMYFSAFKYSHREAAIMSFFRHLKNTTGSYDEHFNNIFPEIYTKPKGPLLPHDTQRFEQSFDDIYRLIWLENKRKVIEFEFKAIGDKIADRRPKTVNSIYDCTLANLSNTYYHDIISNTINKDWETDPFSYYLISIYDLFDFDSIIPNSFYVIIIICIILLLTIQLYHYCFIDKLEY